MSEFLRKVTWEDAKLLLDWSNDEEVRKNSFCTNKITWEEHVRWLERKLDDERCLFYIYMSEKEAVGQIRVDISERTGTISYSIGKAFRGKGYGGRMLNAMEKLIKNEHSEVSCLQAEVKVENIISRRKFENTGYLGHGIITYTKELR